MEEVSHYVQQLLTGDNSVLAQILMCIEGQGTFRLDDNGARLFSCLVSLLVKDGRRGVSSECSGSRAVPTENAVLSLRILQTALMRSGELANQARKALLEPGVGVCREMHLDRFFGLQAWVIPHVTRFVLCLTLLFRIRVADVLSIQANVQLVEQKYRRPSLLAVLGVSSSREINGDAPSLGSPLVSRRYRTLPTNPAYTPCGQNPLYSEGGENIWMPPQFPTPVLELSRQFGLGCEPKLPRTISSILPSASLPLEEPCNTIRKCLSMHVSRRIDDARFFEYQWSPLFRNYLEKGIMIMWGNWYSFSGREDKVMSPIVSREAASPPCVIHPFAITMPVPVLGMACGDKSSYIVTLDNKIHSCGCGKWGQLGSGQWKENVSSNKKSLVDWQFYRVLIKNDDVITRIVAGSAFALALSSQYMYLWGQNSYGQCLLQGIKVVPSPHCVKVPSRFGKITDVSCGSFFVAMAFEDGKLGTWGIASMLGGSLPPERLRTSDTRERTKCALTLNVFKLQNISVRYLRAGPWHCIAITDDGQVFSWGESRDGRLGHGDDRIQEKLRRIEALSNHVVIDASCGSFHSSVLTKEGLVFVFGENSCNQLGLQGQHNRFTPEQLNLPKRAIALSCGREHTCILLEDGDVMSCGSLRASGLGYGYGARLLVPRRILQSYLIFSISSGSMHNIAVGLMRSFTLQFIGSPSVVPQKEALEWVNRISVKSGIRNVAIGKGFFLLVTESGEGHAIGHSQKGQLGCGAIPPNSTDNKIVYKVLLESHKIGFIDCGIDFALAVTTNGTCHSWGGNSHGQLGHGDDVALQACVNVPRLVEALSSFKVVQVACGGTFSLALTQDGDVYSWGEGRYCGLGDSPTTINKPTLVSGLKGIVTIAAGLCHAVVLSFKNIIYAWGRGPLGNGGTQGTTTLTPIALTFPHSVRQLGCGPLNSYAITDVGDLYVWGFNDKWQCGTPQQNDGSDKHKNVPQGVIFPTLACSQVRDAAFTLACGMALKEDGSTVVTGHFSHSGKNIALRSFTPQPPPEPVDSPDSPKKNSSSPSCFITRCFGGYDVLVSVLEWKRPSPSAVQKVVAEMKQGVGMQSVETNRGR